MVTEHPHAASAHRRAVSARRTAVPERPQVASAHRRAHRRLRRPRLQGGRRQPEKGPGKVIAIVVAVLVVLGLGGFAAWKFVGPGASNAAATAPAASDGANGAAGAAGSCSLVSDDDIAAVLGNEGWTALDTGAAVGACTTHGCSRASRSPAG